MDSLYVYSSVVVLIRSTVGFVPTILDAPVAPEKIRLLSTKQIINSLPPSQCLLWGHRSECLTEVAAT